MRVYIAGPITALEHQGISLAEIEKDFRRTAERVYAETNAETVVPFDLHPKEIPWEEALRADIKGLMTCDAIYLRKGWRGSTGAQLEYHIAKSLGFTILYEDPAEKQSGSERFHQILDELGTLHDKKQRDYGSTTDPFANVRASQEFGIPPWMGAVVRGNDKMARIKSFIRNKQLENESLEDSLRDLAVYSIIALILKEEEEKEKSG